jgi:hypothetical protein
VGDESTQAPCCHPSFFDGLVAHWPDRATVTAVVNALHKTEVEAASQPPVVNVTVPGMAGHFTKTAGEETAAWVPGPAPFA